ncbi:MAG: four helix bundle protein [Bacteroidetes bacterium]|nr:four helix bundle protein [Bacteroidota bacterium]
MEEIRENIVKDKSYKFALRIIKLYQFLYNQKHESVLSKQVLRSGTSIGANIEEANGAMSRKDFLNKMYIAHKESRETHYWINLLRDSGYIDEKPACSLISDCEELIRITGKIISSTKKD